MIRPAIRKSLFAAAVLAAVIFGANCSFDPQPCNNEAPFFAGCFEGESTDPAGGKFRIILDAPGSPGSGALGGCLDVTIGNREVVPLAGNAVCVPPQEANLTGMVAGGTTIHVKVVRQPMDGNAVTVDVTSQDSALFRSALGLARCPMVMTCPDATIRTPFGPGSEP